MSADVTRPVQVKSSCRNETLAVCIVQPLLTEIPRQRVCPDSETVSDLQEADSQ